MMYMFTLNDHLFSKQSPRGYISNAPNNWGVLVRGGGYYNETCKVREL